MLPIRAAHEEAESGGKKDTNFTNSHEVAAQNELEAGRIRLAMCHRDRSGSEEVLVLFGHAENPNGTGIWSGDMGRR